MTDPNHYATELSYIHNFPPRFSPNYNGTAMQTFLFRRGDNPRQVMWESLYYLDRLRLGKQRVEASQLLDAIDDPAHGWRSHPACKMWMNYRPALVEYYNFSLRAWDKRGYKNIKLSPRGITSPIVYPPWLIDSPLRHTHRVALTLKNETYYNGRLIQLDRQDEELIAERRRWYIDGDPSVPKTTANAVKKVYYWPGE